MVVATLLTACAMIFNKWMVMDGLSPFQLVWWRSVFAIPSLVILMSITGGGITHKSPQKNLLMIRGLCGFLCMIVYCEALKYLPVFTTESLFHLEPLFVYLMAIVLLKERLTMTSLLAIGICFVGVLFIFHPSDNVFNWGGVMAVLSALLYAFEIILTRVTGRLNSALTMYAYATAVCFVGSSVGMLFEDFIWPHPLLMGGLVIISFLNLGINLSFTEAFRKAPASKMAPLEYLTFIWVAILQFHIWDVIPTASALMGVCCIAAAGFMIMRKELQKD